MCGPHRKEGTPAPLRPGYVLIGPYNEALERRFAEDFDARRALGDIVFAGESSAVHKRMSDILNKQKSITYELAERIAIALRRPDLFPSDAEDTCTHVCATMPGVGVVRSKSHLASTARDDQQPTTARVSSREAILLARADRAVALLKIDDTIHPLDALWIVLSRPTEVADV